VAVREVGAKGLFAVVLTLVTFREVEGQPAVWPDREEHRPCSRLSELRLDEALGSPLGQVPPGDGESQSRCADSLGRTTVDRMSRCILYYDAARAPRSASRCRRRYLLGCPWSVRTERCPTSIARFR
jgi:hypothetical protein